MISILLVTYPGIGSSLLNAANHVVGTTIDKIGLVEVSSTISPEEISSLINDKLADLKNNDGILILVDLYGATHANIACKFTESDKIALVAGVNLPMLLRVLNYRSLPIQKILSKITSCDSDNGIHAQIKKTRSC